MVCVSLSDTLKKQPLQAQAVENDGKDAIENDRKHAIENGNK